MTPNSFAQSQWLGICRRQMQTKAGFNAFHHLHRFNWADPDHSERAVTG